MPNPSDLIIQLITETFPESWYKEYHFDDEAIDNIETVYTTFVLKLEKSKEDFFDYINRSILIGEYISVADFKAVINTIKDSLENIPQPLPSIEALQEKLQSDLNINYIQCLKVALNMYLDFTVWVSVKARLSNVDYISQSNEELSDEQENEDFNEVSIKQLLFVQANLMISRIDHYQTPDIVDYRELFTYSRDLTKPKKLGGNRFSILLKEKNDFLLCKWILRKKDLNRFPVYQIKDSIEHELGIHDLANASVKPWVDIINSHYQFDIDWKQKSHNDFNQLKYTDLKALSMLQLHRLIKYFKDVSKNQKRLNEIRLEVQRRYDTAKSEHHSYNAFVYSIVVNYAINNEFSLLEEGKDYNSIMKLYNEVTDLQSSTGVKNFFPQNKLIGFLTKLLKKKFEEKTALTDLKEVRDLIATCKMIIEKYKANVTWSERNYTYVFYLPFEECFIKTGSSEIESIFIASSFVLTLDKTKYIEDFDEFNKSIESISSSLTIMENVESEIVSLNEMKKELTAVKKDIIAKEMKSMETIAIFTTIVTFVLSSVANFKFIATAYQAALFVLCLATSLGFFVFLLIIIRQGEIADKIRKYFWNLFLLATLGAFFWIILVFSNEIKSFLKKQTEPIRIFKPIQSKPSAPKPNGPQKLPSLNNS
ncbi:MAG: hypothetical protein EOO91_02205 [Pedobacter sp.]|nr:MAG: hypothetical protein EOO91_02205 [Pedobacter sp.]